MSTGVSATSPPVVVALLRCCPGSVDASDSRRAAPALPRLLALKDRATRLLSRAVTDWLPLLLTLPKPLGEATPVGC